MNQNIPDAGSVRRSRDGGWAGGGGVWIGAALPDPASVALAIESGVAAAGAAELRNETWAVKLNLTYPTPLPGVVNSPAFVEGLCRWASDRGLRLVLIEGDGGNGAYSAEDAFEGNGVTSLARRYGAACVSLSRGSRTWRTTPVGWREVRLPYSEFFERKEYDRLVTAPLFKNHIFTTVTLGLKNLWGCIPDPFRMYYHHLLDPGIVALYKELSPSLSIFDGLTGLAGRGPMEGIPVPMNTIMVSASPGAADIAALRIMNVPLAEVRHLRIAVEEGCAPAPEQVAWLADPSAFLCDGFVLRRTLLNQLSIQLARFPTWQRLVYHAPWSRAIYGVVNRIRGDSAQTRLHQNSRSGLYHSSRPGAAGNEKPSSRSGR